MWVCDLVGCAGVLETIAAAESEAAAPVTEPGPGEALPVKLPPEYFTAMADGDEPTAPAPSAEPARETVHEFDDGYMGACSVCGNSIAHRLHETTSVERVRGAREVAHQLVGDCAGGLELVDPSGKRSILPHGKHCNSATAAIEERDRARQPADVERLRAYILMYGHCKCVSHGEGPGAFPSDCVKGQALSLLTGDADVERLRTLLEEGARLATEHSNADVGDEAGTFDAFADWARQVREELPKAGVPVGRADARGGEIYGATERKDGDGK